jgi:hypothetical protein
MISERPSKPTKFQVGDYRADGYGFVSYDWIPKYNKWQEHWANLDNRKKNHNNYHRRVRYNITPEMYQKMILIQNNCCAICNCSFVGMKPRRIHIDHDHKTGKIRGILCQKCNHIIGNALDNVLILKKTIKYLEVFL